MNFQLAQLDFAHPGRLAALLILPLIVLVAYRYAARFDAAWQRTASLACRLALVALLIAALAGPLFRQATPEKFVVFAVDDSASISEATRAEARKFMEQAKAAGNGTNSTAFSFGGNTVKLDETVDGQTSDPARAILAAAATLPTNYVSEVVLLSDGRQTHGDLLTAAERAGVPVSVVPLPAFSEPEVSVASVAAPAEARPGETVSLQVVVEANGINSGHVEVVNTSTKKLVSQPLETVAGTNRITLGAECGTEKATTFEVRLTGFQDRHAENNLAAVVVQTLPPLRVLVVDADAARGGRLAGVLKQQGLETATLAPGALPKLATGLAAHDVIILSSPDPKGLAPEQASALTTYVRGQGGGLIVLGPVATFGAENYQASSLESLLPVAALAKTEERKASLALTLIIDRSASMLEDDRLGLAKEAAKQAVALLTPNDKAGVMAFGSESEWISEIYPASDKPELLRRIGTLKAEGQTNMYPALVKAFLAMEQTDADRRHVILLTDGTPSPGDFQEIASRMAAAGITVSTVSISKGAEQSILKDISRAANGQHHHCDNPADVPKILVQETKAASAVAVSEFQPRVFRQLPGLDVAAAPLLSGAVAVSPKTRAEILLIGAEGDPLVSWWRYGDGVAVALAADVQQHWQGWPGYGKFWSRLVRHAAKDTSPRGFSFQLSRSGSKGIATLEALAPDGKFLDGARAVLDLTAPETKARQLELAQVAPGRYQTTFDMSSLGAYDATVSLTDPQASTVELFRATRSHVHTYPDELRVGPTNEALLREVARVSGGTYDPKPEAVFAPTDRTVNRETPLALFFVLAAALVLVADVAVRRYYELFGAASAADRKQLDQGNHVGGANEAA